MAVARAGFSVPLLAVVAGVNWLMACSDHPGAPRSGGPPLPPTDLFVSGPVRVPSAAVVASSAARSGAAAATDSSATVAYVSLSPGTVPGAGSAIVRRVGATASVTTAAFNGGFDPVPVAAQAGDSVDVRVTDAGGSVLLQQRVAVLAAAVPYVVRSSPPKLKRDVPLNSRIFLVFSEPVAGSTVTASSVYLMQGPTQVPGTASLLQGSATGVVFTPSASLAANTDYQLVVTQGITDLNGNALPATATVSFTTGTAVEGVVASVVVSPDSAEVLVGSQYQLSVTALDASGHEVVGRPVTWAASDSAVATISSTGLVTAVAPGIAFFGATVDGRVGGAVIYVSAQLPSVASVVVSPKSDSVFAGRTITLSAQARDSLGNVLGLRLIGWTSTNSAVATVAPSSQRNSVVVTGVAPGVANIIASAEGKSDTAGVKVTTGPPIVAFTISPDSLPLIFRGGAYVSGVETAADGWKGPVSSLDITWSTADSTIATVSASGFVSAGRAGSTTITATWSGFTATANVRVAALQFTSVSAAYEHACGLTTVGAVYCWGSNGGYAGLGDGTTNPSPFPVLVTGGLTFTSISVGGYHMCGLISSGAAYCWAYNALGEIGDGTNTDRHSPVPVVGGHQFRILSAGDTHTCAIDLSGAAYCWGQNWDGATGGKLGDGTITNSTVPVAVLGGLTFATISGGENHTCGVTSAGRAYCWGSNFDGDLGTGTSAALSTTPVAVAGNISFLTVGAAASTSCGLAADSAAYCWGRNYGGVPVLVAGGLKFATLSMGGIGSSHTCAVTAGGAAYCWGDNGSGELGDGTQTSTIAPVAVVGGLSYANVAAGAYLSCGVTLAGVAYCWGDNQYGELGNNSFVSSLVPVRVAGQP